MPRTCERVADCRAQREAGWYCPCRVRSLLRSYADLLDSGATTPGGGGGPDVRVLGGRAAYDVGEEALCVRADLARALLAVTDRWPLNGLVVALSHGLDVRDGRVVPLVRAPGERPSAPSWREIAALVAQRRSGAPTLRSGVTLAAVLDVGIEAVSYDLGWRPGYDDAPILNRREYRETVRVWPDGGSCR